MFISKRSLWELIRCPCGGPWFHSPFCVCFSTLIFGAPDTLIGSLLWQNYQTLLRKCASQYISLQGMLYWQAHRQPHKGSNISRKDFSRMFSQIDCVFFSSPGWLNEMFWLASRCRQINDNHEKVKHAPTWGKYFLNIRPPSDPHTLQTKGSTEECYAKITGILFYWKI